MSTDNLAECYENCIKYHGDNPTELQICYSICDAQWKQGTRCPGLRSFKDCFPQGVMELEEFMERYRENSMGYEDWQIVAETASVIDKMLEEGRKNECSHIENTVVKVVSDALDCLGINRNSIRKCYGHGIPEETKKILEKIFPNIEWKEEQKLVRTRERIIPSSQPIQSPPPSLSPQPRQSSLPPSSPQNNLPSLRSLARSGAYLGDISSLLVLTIILSGIGFILMPIALRRLSRAYGNGAIWRNTFYAILTVVVSIALFIPFTLLLGISGYIPSNGAFIRALILYVFVFSTITGWFLRKAYRELDLAGSVEEFSKAARWILIGAILYAIGIGIIFI